MKLIIAGSRTLNPTPTFIFGAMESFDIADYVNEIVCGGAAGVDCAGEHMAFVYNLNVKLFPANWKEQGKSAGPIRNKAMADYSDALLLIWDGQSKGSKNMKTTMEKLNKPVYEVILK